MFKKVKSNVSNGPIDEYTVCKLNIITFKEYLKVLNRLYDITWFGAVYA
jgi:hypothetical protein